MSTAIEWTDKTLNPGIYGCSEVSPACKECYAAKMAHRLVAMGVYPAGITKKTAAGIHWSGKVVVDYAAIDKAFSKLPKRKPARVFVTSMSDLFHEDVPFEFISRVFDEMNERQHLTFQVLTKRAERMAEWWAWESDPDVGDGARWCWPVNVWAGCTVEDQKRADERLPYLLSVPAAVRFLSCEPLLGPVDLECIAPLPDGTHYGPLTGPDGPGIHWVITGCESVAGKREGRPTRLAWTQDLRDQCTAAEVPFFLKQMAVDGRVVSGGILGGTWQQFPVAS